MTSPNCARFIWKRKRRLTVIITQTVHFKAAVTILTQSPPSALPHHTNMGQKSPVKAANRRILLSTSTSVWSWLDKVGMDSRKCIFSLMAWAGGLETWVTEQSIIGITVGIYSYLSLLDLDFNERLTSWSPLNIPLLFEVFSVFNDPIVIVQAQQEVQSSGSWAHGLRGRLQVHLLFLFTYVKQSKVQECWVKVYTDQRGEVINTYSLSQSHQRSHGYAAADSVSYTKTWSQNILKCDTGVHHHASQG